MVRVELGELACSGLEGHFGSDVKAGIRKAVLHYAYKLRVGRPPVAPPRFLEEASGHRQVFELTFDSQVEAVLRQEALKQRVTVERLAAHAVLVYLAELEFLGLELGTTPGGERGA
jgi:hypothetical protein